MGERSLYVPNGYQGERKLRKTRQTKNNNYNRERKPIQYFFEKKGGAIE